LGSAGVPVLALDPQPHAIGFSSRYVTQALVCPDPGDQEEEFLDFLEELGAHLSHPGVLFLTRDQDVSTVSRAEHRLRRHFHVPFAGWDVLGGIVDKRGQYAVARSVNVPLPLTRFPVNEREARGAAGELPYPVILKPAYHVRFAERFGVKGLVAYNPDQVVDHYRRGVAHGYRMMIQEIIPGSADRLYTYGSYLNAQGEPLAEFTGRKLRQHPREFGTCRLGECCPAPDVVHLGLRLLRALNFWGISQVEFKLDPRDDQFKLMEVNARNYQWQHLATVCGANLAHVAYQDALGMAVEPVSAEAYGRCWALALTDLAVTPGEILRGETSLWNWLTSWRGVRVDGILSCRDPRPGLRYLRSRVKGRLRQPVRNQPRGRP
jgi:predicted ATP-grasp superfamily ATP-dependent carboligase